MSVDTITRVNAYFKAQIADIFPVYTIYDNDNFDLPESGDGPMVKLFVEPAIDNILTDNALYQEDGVIIAQIFVEIGESTLILHQIADDIKEAFRQVTLEPEFTTENSAIAFEDIEFANGGTVDKEDEQSTIQWKRWDVFVTYSKYDCQTSSFFVSNWNTENLGGTGSATKTIVLPMTAGNLIDWGDGTIDNTNTHVYASGGVKTVRIDGDITGFRFNNAGDKSKMITVSNTGGLVIDNSDMFFGCDNIVIWVNNPSISITTNSLNRMFFGCSLVGIIDLSFFNTELVEDMGNMFGLCISLIELNISSFDTGLVVDFGGFIQSCSSLASLDVTKFNTSSTTNMNSMFRGLLSISDISGIELFNISIVSDMSNFLLDVGIITSKYSTLLINYESQSVQNNVPFHGGNSKFSSGAAATARQALIDDHTWTITDGGPA